MFGSLFQDKNAKLKKEALQTLNNDTNVMLTSAKVDNLQNKLLHMDTTQAQVIMSTLANLVTLQAQGVHDVFISDMQYRLTFKNGNLCNIEII